MKKNKRHSDPCIENDTDGESTDDKSHTVNGTGQQQVSAQGSLCNHSKFVDRSKLEKCLKSNGIKLVCTNCLQSNITDVEPLTVDCNENQVRVDTEPTSNAWICLICGATLCGPKSTSQHALDHSNKVFRPKNHSIFMNIIRHDEVYCYICNITIDIIKWNKHKELTDLVNKFINKKNAETPHEETNDSTLENNMITSTNVNNHNTFNYFSDHSNIKDVVTKQRPPSFNQYPNDSLPRVRGLSNLGNTCFFNAVMQCLGRTPFLLAELKKRSIEEDIHLIGGPLKIGSTEIELPSISGKLIKRGNLTDALTYTLEDLQKEGGILNPRQLFDVLTHEWPQFYGGDQHDSHELLRHLLESVRTEDIRRYQKVILDKLNYVKKDHVSGKLPSDFRSKCNFYNLKVKDNVLSSEKIFRGDLVSILKCQECYHTSTRHEDFLDLSLPISIERPLPPQRQRLLSTDSAGISGTADANITLTSPRKSKAQVKKEKKLQKRNEKRERKQLTEAANPLGGDREDSLSNGNSAENCSKSSSGEPSDADIEDNVLDDDLSIQDMYTSPTTDNTNLDMEKNDNAPENTNKYTLDENDSGIATNPCHSTDNLAISKQNGDSSKPNADSTYFMFSGISQLGSNMLRKNCNQPTLDISAQFSELNLNSAQSVEHLRQSQRQKNASTGNDWSSTLAPQYRCTEGECSIQSCLFNFTAKELMTNNNKVGCEQCTERKNGPGGKTINTTASKQLLISKCPPILILHLKRFQVGPRSMFKKLSNTVTFPFILDIAPFCSAKIAENSNVNTNQTKILYSLYGVVVHQGSMFGGHYTAYVKVRRELEPTDPRYKFLPKEKLEQIQRQETNGHLSNSATEQLSNGQKRVNLNDSDDAMSTVSTSSSSTQSSLDESINDDGIDEKNTEPPFGKWYWVSDTSVSVASEEDVLKAQAYLLFYERIY